VYLQGKEKMFSTKTSIIFVFFVSHNVPLTLKSDNNQTNFWLLCGRTKLAGKGGFPYINLLIKMSGLHKQQQTKSQR